jgi:hypothetical protein
MKAEKMGQTGDGALGGWYAVHPFTTTAKPIREDQRATVKRAWSTLVSRGEAV